jgi:hypothetical protein
MQSIQINRLEDHGAIILVDEYSSINLLGPKLQSSCTVGFQRYAVHTSVKESE